MVLIIGVFAIAASSATASTGSKATKSAAAVTPPAGGSGYTGHVTSNSDPNPLYSLQTVQIKGGYESAGVAMRNLGYGTIDLTGIPSGSTVEYAYLLWDILNDSPTPATGEGTFASTAITGTAIGHGESPCWPEATDNYSYVANVTSLVSGNGDYDLAGFASGATNGEDPWNVGSPAPDAEGASLVVIYANSASPLTTIQLLGGSTETDSGNLLTQTLNGFTATSSPSASTTFIVADGQGIGSEGGFNSTQLVNPFLGSAPQAVPNYSEGNLWDNLTFDVSSDVSGGDTSESAYVEGDEDCLVWIGQVFAVTATPQTVVPPTYIGTSLSGGAQSGPIISVPTSTAVTDSATLSGTNASEATGTVTYNVYSDSACTDLVNGGSAETITTPGTLPDSAPVTLSTAGNYFWQASYSGDANNGSSTSTCGSEEEVVTTGTGTSLSTSLSGDSQTGTSISVPPGTAVTDSATLSGANASEATGTVTYNVYSDSACTDLVNGGSAETITTPGTLPDSAPVTLSTPDPYYWQASYSGDSNNGASTSTCGSEVETVTKGSSTPTCTLSTVNVGPPSQLVFTAQDSVSGLSTVTVVRHHNSTSSISSFSSGTTSPVTGTFTKKKETAGGNGGIKATNTGGNSVSCAAQYKTVRPLRVNTQGFTFKKTFDNLVIQNGTKGLKSVQVNLNGGPATTINLTPGETYTETLTGLTKRNKLVVEGFGKSTSAAVVAVWGYLK